MGAREYFLTAWILSEVGVTGHRLAVLLNSRRAILLILVVIS